MSGRNSSSSLFLIFTESDAESTAECFTLFKVLLPRNVTLVAVVRKTQTI